MMHVDPAAAAERFARACFLDPNDTESAARLALAGALGFGPMVTSGRLTVAQIVELRLAPILADLALAAQAEVERAYQAGVRSVVALVPCRPDDPL